MRGMDRPPSAVVSAFGGAEPVERLEGGRGMTWRAGPVVLRPAEDRGETEWASEVLSRLDVSADFGLADPLRDDRGSWTRDGWHALRRVPGAPDPSRLDDVLRAGAAFHRALADVPVPSLLAERDHPWARADRIAWGEDEAPRDELLAALLGAYRPLELPSQLIHGDLLGNVLFAAVRPPVVIDWAPYVRPVGYAAAIAVTDAVCWHGLPLARLGDDGGFPEWRQLLLRALVFRIATFQLAGSWSPDLLRRHEAVVRRVLG